MKTAILSIDSIGSINFIPSAPSAPSVPSVPSASQLEKEFGDLLTYISNNPDKIPDLEDSLKYGNDNVKAIYLRNILTEQPIATDEPPRKRPRLVRGHPNVIISKNYTPDVSEFSKFITTKTTFVDKSLFIMEFMIYGKQASLITCPRQFGKSTNLSILNDFLASPLTEEERTKRLSLFKNLKIFKFDWFYKVDNSNETYFIRTLIARAGNDEDFFKKILKGITDQSALISSLSSLTRYLHECYNKSSVILIDEYDWPMEHTKDKDYKDINSLFQSMYSNVAKKEPNIDVIYTLLYYSGYLVAEVDGADDRLKEKVIERWENNAKFKLIIPNREVAEQWRLKYSKLYQDNSWDLGLPLHFTKKNIFVSARVSQRKESGLSIPSDWKVSLSAESEPVSGSSYIANAKRQLIKLDLEDNGGNDNMKGNYDDNTQKSKKCRGKKGAGDKKGEKELAIKKQLVGDFEKQE
ncbi:hypothetical protein C1645_811649 [Glomus cerebriforme]|uniref:AAA-ATPase-like domain-containing protein n=1 Tax=Glomus cerebriforme TaxID=658196 RepID=A0A397TMJ5_9GLOM|nr:hypothetical protein C1645_811649 [Glomus cerebriforme]